MFNSATALANPVASLPFRPVPHVCVVKIGLFPAVQAPVLDFRRRICPINEAMGWSKRTRPVSGGFSRMVPVVISSIFQLFT